MGFQFFSFIFLILTALPTHAYEEDQTKGYVSRKKNPRPAKTVKKPIKSKPFNLGQTRIDKFNFILDTLGIPVEATPLAHYFPQNFSVSAPEIKTQFRIIDPDLGLARYLEQDSKFFSLYQDFFSANASLPPLERTIQLNSTGPAADSGALMERLGRVHQQAINPRVLKPLAGLRVVIDPGHMGTDFWDEETGKYVEIIKSNIKTRVSEGELTLWTAYLVANELESLGANVTLTRTELGPVAKTNYLTFDESPYRNQYFYNSLDSWMTPYLNLSATQIQNSIKSKPEVTRAYAASQKTQFFIGGEDLEARSQLIDELKPDVVLDIHFDADKLNALQKDFNSIEAFVPGGFRASETGSRKLRSFALKQLLDVRRFNESVKLASAVVQSLSSYTGLPLEKDPEFLTSIKVQDGVYARNLYITRRNLESLMVYLECLHYDHINEYDNLTKKTEEATYHGIRFQYPSRLNSVVGGIRQGFLNYFRSN